MLRFVLKKFLYSNLSRRRYAQNDDTLYVAPEDERTDYVRFDSLPSFLRLSISFKVPTTNGQLVLRCSQVRLSTIESRYSPLNLLCTI